MYLERNANEEFPTAQVYLALQRLWARRLIALVREEKSVGRRGHPRRIYELTASGLRSLEAGLRLFALPASQKHLGENEQAGGVLSPKPA
jgi:DNA-binding PadR family transcriptional regulator